MTLLQRIAIAFFLIMVPFLAISADVKLPAVFEVANEKLVLNGTGVRQKLTIDLYVGGLYLKEKNTDPAQVINANEPMAIKLDVVSNLITSKRLEEGMRSEFKRVTKGKIGPYKSRIETLVKAFKKDVNVGDVFDIVYLPDHGLMIYKNKQLSATIPGLDFKQMLFTTWFGNDPADKKFKEGMLGA